MAAKRPPTGTRTTTPTPPPTTTTGSKLTPAAQLAHDRFTLLLLNLVGTRVLVTLKGGQQIKGILATASTDSSELSIVLRQAQAQAQSPHSTESNGNGNGAGTAAEKPKEEPVKSALIIQGRDLVGVETIEEVELVGLPLPPQSIGTGTTTGTTTNVTKATEEAPKSIERESFKTDTDISGLNQSRGEKQLKAWGGGGGAGADDSLSLTFDNPSSASPRAGGAGGGQWDQFATNERLYGVKTDYDEEMYTTKLDRSGADYKERMKRAAILEQEIMKGSHSSALASNAHMNEERGINPAGVDDSGLDEEDRYGAVIRGPSAYVPPGARKAAAALSAKLGTTPPPPPSSALPSNGATPASSSVDWVTVSKKGLPSTTGTGTGAIQGKGMSIIPAIQEPPPSSTPTPTPTQQKATTATRPVPDLEPTFRQFVSNEKERLTMKRNAAVKAAEKADQDSRLKSLLQFSQTFKLPKNVSEASNDMASILGHDPVKKASTSSTAATPISSPSRPTPRTLTPATNTATNKPSNASTPSRLPTTTSSSSSSLLPEIPPFKGKSSSTTTTPAVSPKSMGNKVPLPTIVGGPTASTSSSSSKINPNAKPFVFKPNPNASAFTPSFASVGTSSTPSPGPATTSNSTPVATARKVTVELSPGNAFFGNKTIKKGSSSMHVKEDFTPFSKQGQIQSPEQVAPTWSFTSRPYRQIYSISPTPPPNNEDEQGQVVPGSSGSGPTNGGPSHLPPIPTPQGLPIQQQQQGQGGGGGGGGGGPTFVYQQYQPGGFAPQRFAQPQGQQPPPQSQQPNQQQQQPPPPLQHMMPPPGAMGFHQYPPPPPPMGFNPNQQQGGPHMYTPNPGPGMQSGVGVGVGVGVGAGGVVPPPPPLNPQAYMRFAQFPPGQQNGVPIGFVDPARSMVG